MAAGIGASANLLFYLRVFDHALEDARAAHQDVVLLLIGYVVGGTRVVFRALKVAAIEVEVGGIEVDGADSVMIGTLLVDGARRIKVFEGFAPKLR